MNNASKSISKRIRKSKSVLNAWLLSVTLGLVACAHQTLPSDKPLTHDWQLDGKLAVRYPAADNCRDNFCPKQSDQGNIRWQQRGDDYTILLSDPFGRVLFNVSGDNKTLRFKAVNQAIIEAPTTDFLRLILSQPMAQSLDGLSPELLRYWVSGRPAPQLPFKKTVDGFEQAGFTISAKQWRKSPIGTLPALTVVKKDQMMLRLVVRDWQQL